MSDIFTRTRGLIGDDYEKIKNKRVLVIGLGGVGGTVFSSLVRSGVTHFQIIDFDKVEESNLNRQILYTFEDIGLNKCDVAASNAKSVNPDIEVTALAAKISEENIDEVLDGHYDYICDAVDDIKAKVAIAKYAIKHNIPLIVATGAANKVDPYKIKISTLNKSEGDPLAKRLRASLRAEGVDISSIYCAYSNEKNEKAPKTTLNSIIFVTSSMGLAIGNFIFNELLK